jgi:tetratricopeptide (TPR) repeat protein
MAESHREEIAKLEALYAGNPGGRVFVHLAEAYRKAGEHERARRILDEGLARHTDSASGFVVLGRVLADMQIGDEAEVAFRRVLELDSGNLVALRWLGDLARQGGRMEEAAGHYRDLLARNPSNEEVRDLVEIVEREASGPHATAETGLDAPGLALDDPAAEWQEPAAREPVEQVPTSPDGELTPLSAAPGGTGETEPADIEYGLVDVQALPLEPETTDAEYGTSTPVEEPAAHRVVEEEVVEAFEDAPDEALAQLNELARSDEADALEIHLLDPSYAEEERVEDPGFELLLPEQEELSGDYADEEFIADLLHAGEGEPVEDAVQVDSLDMLGDSAAFTLDPASAAADDAPSAAQDVEPARSPADTYEPPVFADTLAVETPAEESATPPHGDALADAIEHALEPGSGPDFPSADAIEEALQPASGADFPSADAIEDAFQFGTHAEFPSGDPEATPPHGDGLLDAMDSLAAEYADDLPPEPDAAAFADATDPDFAEDLPAEADTVAAAGTSDMAGPAVTDGPEAGAGAAAGAAGLMTETMAELYRSQGFHDRAADVYRALLRNRPYDLRLSALLSETEADAAEVQRAAAPEAAPEDEATGEVWLRGVGAPWDAGAAVDEGATPYVWTQDPDEAPAGEPIGTYLRDLIGWRTASQRWAEAAPPQQPAPPPQPAAADAWSASDEPWATTPAEPDTPWGVTPAADTVDPWGASAPAGESALGRPTPPAPEPADPWGTPAAPAAESAPGAADPWGGGESAVEPAEAEAFKPWTPDDLPPPAPSVRQPATAVPPMAVPEPEPDESAEDEDLEMFRSWLQSLKK